MCNADPYTAWITDSSTLIAELWYLAYSDLLTGPIPNSSIPNPVLEHEGIEEPHSGRSPTPKNPFSSSSRCMSRTRSESAVDQSFPLSVPTATCMVPSIVDPVAIRAIWYRIESHHSCLTPLPVYLLRPGRHFRQYCVLFGSLLTKYTPSHPDLIACKGERYDVFMCIPVQAQLLLSVLHADIFIPVRLCYDCHTWSYGTKDQNSGQRNRS
ncbi:hypothetical protein D915_006451 [Fasciola hepatica]|uniref:Uncharacterized protein n=1 Tax=Fasciola hepatica TaxID=6192 RepID=A0A4E0RN71_FASHE|nr:hypothetical protein D915_006451 [Fasciola hepatica]